MFKAIFRCSSILFLAVYALTSCTVSEPNETKEDAGTLRLESMTFSGMNQLIVKYDDQKRISTIEIPGDELYEFYYNGNSSTPHTIVDIQYMDYFVDNKNVLKESSRERWSNITTNSDGYITSADIRAVYYNYHRIDDSETGNSTIDSSQSKTMIGKLSAKYSGKHLTEYVEKFNDGTTSTDTYTWTTDGLLTHWDSTQDGGYYTDGCYAEIEYCDTDNIHRQWVSDENMISTINITGLFGEAPTKFVSCIKVYDKNEARLLEHNLFAFNILSNGLINKCHFRGWEYDGESSGVINFNYIKL